MPPRLRHAWKRSAANRKRRWQRANAWALNLFGVKMRRDCLDKPTPMRDPFRGQFQLGPMEIRAAWALGAARMADISKM